MEVGAIAATAHQAVATAQALTQLLAKDKARLAELGRLAAFKYAGFAALLPQ